ncbi:hypothetical protein WHJ50_14445 [Staphylococcus aureus]|uniref:hypothetical protein n=1 Tax=Staphylococcus aureus TaxID=1280 RepID=UPI0039BE0BA0
MTEPTMIEQPSEVYLLLAYSNEVVYGQSNGNKDILEVFLDPDLAWARKYRLEETVGKKFNVTYTVETKPLTL